MLLLIASESYSQLPLQRHRGENDAAKMAWTGVNMRRGGSRLNGHIQHTDPRHGLSSSGANDHQYPAAPLSMIAESLAMGPARESDWLVARFRQSIGSDGLSTGPNGQVVWFLTDDLFSAPPGIDEFLGTIVGTGSIPVSVLAVQKRGD